MVRASVVVRTKNEERWIGHCLRMVHAQAMDDHEVVLVDNGSTDDTVAVAERVGVDRVVTIAEYRPGLALNRGIEASRGEYLVCLSGHCVPRDAAWLGQLLEGFEDPSVAGVYGRQIPVAFSPDNDKRDLLITFGLERRVQTKDYFFHNANSGVRRSVWAKIPFDSQTTNIEDRIWGKEVVARGHHLVYEPEAVVYHHHGLHQDQHRERARSVVSVLKGLEPPDLLSGLPVTMRPGNAQVVAVCPVLGPVKRHEGRELLTPLLKELAASEYVTSAVVVAEDPEARRIADAAKVEFLERPPHLASPERTLEEVLKHALRELEHRGTALDVLVYANYLYPRRPAGYIDALVQDLLYKGLDSVFGGLPDFNNYWVASDDGDFSPVGDSLKARAAKRPMYRALYGLGTAVVAPVIRRGTLVGERVGIAPLADESFVAKVM